MSDHDDDNETQYLSLGDDYRQMVDGYGAAERGVAGLKLVGKGLFNVAKFGVAEVLPAFVKQAEKIKERNS